MERRKLSKKKENFLELGDLNVFIEKVYWVFNIIGGRGFLVRDFIVKF